jgi:hypothetical protein
VESDGQLYVEDEMGAEKGFEVIHCPHSDPDAPSEAYGGGHGTIGYYLVGDFIDTLESGSLRPPIDVIRAMDMTVPGICAHEAAMSAGEWVDVPAFEW